jgi:lipid-binding SYLF domain-containing protein
MTTWFHSRSAAEFVARQTGARTLSNAVDLKGRQQMKYLRAVAVLAVAVLSLPSDPVFAGNSFEDDANAALKKLYDTEPVARTIGEKAKAILVFPSIVKAGFIVGGQYGEGVLLMNGTIIAQYNSVAASYGLQAGVQSFGYALFLMNDKALEYLNKSDGWEIGVGPSIVIVDKGIAKLLTTTTLNDDVYAFIFSQKGLMAGLGIQGSKITKLEK